MRRIYLLASYLLLFSSTRSQNLTGTWEGIMGSEFIQVNIVHKGNDLCGYTYDYELGDKKSFCRAYFTGKYNKEKDEWRIAGSAFIQNSGSHILMRLRLWRDDMEDNTLQGMQYPKGFLNVLSFGMGTPLTLKKVSSRPTKLPDGKDPCPEEEPVKNNNAPDPRDLAPNKKPPVQPARPEPIVKDTAKKPAPVVVKPPVVKKDSPAVVLPPVVKKDTVAVIKPPLKVTERTNKAIRTLTVNTKTISLKVYDNATVDGDTVSIYYDGKLLVNKKGLSVLPIELTIELDESRTKHELIMYAENLGSIPPNTALIVVTAGEKRYELFASSSLSENAVLIFEYKPD
jgi:hypothetical protein